MDFEFRTFSTRSFERFAQALTMHALGSGIFVFGDGPDGGREASYDGTLDFPTIEDRWSGYTVVQAKFRQVPGTTGEDAAWLVKQLTDEFEKLLEADNKLKTPDYYILVTNARLSSVPESARGKGGLAKIDQVFAKYKTKLGIRDYRVWHLDAISAMLTNARELRRSYAAWLTPSDIIADLVDAREGQATAFAETMYRYLSRELRHHRPLRLQQAGHGSDAQTMIEDVFTDLPFLTIEEEGEPDKLLLADLVRRSRDCLDGASVKAQHRGQRGRPERLLLLGGPGQGKSTASQFLAQILRANMLGSDQLGLIAVDTAAIVDSTLEGARAAGIAVDIPRRFPFRVDLPTFADAMSATPSGRLSLLAHLAEHIATSDDTQVDVGMMRKWIRSQPCAFILDGLDEVPPSANRADVIRAINDFWDEASECDVLMLVTTRPQGYNDDLDPALWTKLEMTALKPHQAVAYATKLALNRISEPVQRDRVMERLRTASASPATARLMVSPLQVAILLALIDQRGDAPNDRWSLFEKYFNVVLEREQSKPGDIGETMRRWHRPIAGLHHRAGFLLHVEAETQGNSEAYLTPDQLGGLIRSQLADDDHEGEQLEEITAELLAASTERLVLLVQREEGRFSFEVRSLQEFMAAAYIMTGRDLMVQERLQSIANKSHWLHVFQIAASKCFAVPESGHYRDTIVTICRMLNESDQAIDRLLRTGSQLAIDLLDDGLAYDQPKYRRLLISLALDIVHAGVGVLDPALVTYCDMEPSRTIEQLRPHLQSPTEETRSAAWTLLLQCASLSQSWADALLPEVWPTEEADLAALFACPVTPVSGSPFDHRMRASLEQISPLSIIDAIDEAPGGEGAPRVGALAELYPCLSLLHDERSQQRQVSLWLRGKSTPLTFYLESVDLSEERRTIYEDLPQTGPWRGLRELAAFHLDPTAANLAALLELAAEHHWLKLYQSILIFVPWPLATLVIRALRGESLVDLAKQVRAGEVGDTEAWRAAERRWSADGIVAADLVHAATHGMVDRGIAHVGLPWASLSLTFDDDDGEWIGDLIEIGERASGMLRWFLRRLVNFAITAYPPDVSLGTMAINYLLETGDGIVDVEHLRPGILRCVPLNSLTDPALLQKLNTYGLASAVYIRDRGEWDGAVAQELVDQVDTYPGLLAILSGLVSISRTRIAPKLIPSPKLRTMLASEHDGVASCAAVLLLFEDTVSREGLARLLKAPVAFPTVLLSFLLDQGFFSQSACEETTRIISECVNADPELSAARFRSAIRAFADKRVADLHQPEVWRRLELGEALLGQILQRRAT